MLKITGSERNANQIKISVIYTHQNGKNVERMITVIAGCNMRKWVLSYIGRQMEFCSLSGKQSGTNLLKWKIHAFLICSPTAGNL